MARAAIYLDRATAETPRPWRRLCRFIRTLYVPCTLLESLTFVTSLKKAFRFVGAIQKRKHWDTLFFFSNEKSLQGRQCRLEARDQHHGTERSNTFVGLEETDDDDDDYFFNFFLALQNFDLTKHMKAFKGRDKTPGRQKQVFIFKMQY